MPVSLLGRMLASADDGIVTLDSLDLDRSLLHAQIDCSVMYAYHARRP